MNHKKTRPLCRKCWTTHGRARGSRPVCLAEAKPRFTPGQMAYMLHQAAAIRQDEEAREQVAA